MKCDECSGNIHHESGRFPMGCIFCYSRWLVHKHEGNKRLIWTEIKSDKRYDVDALTNEVRKLMEKRR